MAATLGETLTLCPVVLPPPAAARAAGAAVPPVPVRARGPADGQGVAEDQHGTKRIGNHADGTIHRSRRDAVRERERIRARDRDDLVQERPASDMPLTSPRDAVVGVVEAGPRTRGCRAGAPVPPYHRCPPVPVPVVVAATPPAGAPNWPAAAIGAIPSLRSRCICVLERDHDLGIVLEGRGLAREGLGSSEGKRRGDDAVLLAGTNRVADERVVSDVPDALVDRLGSWSGRWSPG